MSTLVYSLINLLHLTTGRRLYALKKCLAAAKKVGASAQLISLIEQAISHDTAAVDMEVAWSRSKKISTARGESANLDNQIDGVLGAIQSSLKNNIAVLPGDDPIAAASNELMGQIFPEGVHAIITLPFEDQLVMNESIISRLQGEFAGDAATTGITPFVERLASLNAQFRVELEKTSEKEIAWNTIAAAADKGNLYLRQITAIVLGNYYEDTPEAAQMRKALLSPIVEQCDRVRLARKGRRPAKDVDPNTGEELENESAAA
ncbi:MAG: hypothetical protein JXR76_23845 [Deltaproteobacteria bacterium]|nr:hypothetical protein [Deltaproteobacteria bacterium]